MRLFRSHCSSDSLFRLIMETTTSISGCSHSSPPMALNHESRPVKSARHVQILVISSSIVILALLLKVVPPDRVAFRFAPSWVLPETCGSRLFFGMSCPGCGLTRSFVYLARGEFSNSYQVNRVGGVIAIAVLLQIPYRVLALRSCRYNVSPQTAKWFGNFLIAVLVANWIWSLLE